MLLYFARGSSQTMAETTSGFGRPGQELLEALEQRYEPGVVGTMADAYPAVPALSVFNGRYFPSAENGAQAAVYNSEDLSLLCPSSWLVLGGYSQGAQAIRTALATIDEVARERIAAVVLFGDPYFDPAEPNVVALSSFDPGGGRLHRGSLRNMFPSRAPRIGAQWQGRVFSWCHARDAVCQTTGGTASHYTYAQDAGEAAASIVKRLGEVGLAPELLKGGESLAVPYRVRGTCLGGTCGLAVWSGPGTSAFGTVGAVHEGQRLSVLCQVRGQRMLGPSARPSAIWDRLASGGFVSDLYLNTPAVGRFSSTLARCTGLSVGAASGTAK
ncbi:MAG TPA: cutinase family protein [Solirubrobacteraceae bacterium]|nr:cutinase family protein [Solirubrobacteraceae bacterium]